MKIKQVVCPEPAKVVIEEKELDTLKEGEILIKTQVTLISPGTERAWFLNKAENVTFPYLPGYCNVGEVIELGPGVKEVNLDLKEGDLVVNQANHTSAAIVKADEVLKVPENLTPETAVYTPLAEISFQALRKIHIDLGQSVVILGLGVIGLLAVKFAKLSGAYPLVGSDLSAYRRELSLKSGVDQAIAPDELMSSGYDVVIDATGYPDAFKTSVELAARLGIICLLGSTRGNVDDLNIYQIHYKGLSIVGAHSRINPEKYFNPKMWPMIKEGELFLKLLSDKVIDINEITKDKITPEEIPAMFDRLKERDEKLLGCIVDWR